MTGLSCDHCTGIPLFDFAVLTLAKFHPSRFPYGRFVLTLALGTGAGFAFKALGAPLPWMLGPISVCTIAVLAGLPVNAPAVVRPPMTAMLGVMLGASFSPALLAQIPRWSLTLALQLVLLAMLSVIGVWFYRTIVRLDPVTAFYAGMPGGMMEMSLIGEERGGDGQAIILIHSARILMIVATTPFIVQWIDHVELGPRVASPLSVVDAPATTFLWLIGLAVVGVVAGQKLKLPARYLFGPMLLSMLVHGTGLTDFIMPREVVIAAQVMIGCIIGCRFLGYEKRAILKILAYSGAISSVLIAVTVVFAMGVSWLFGIGLSRLVLALVPGGIAEMSLIAVALHIDVAFVLVHQLVRIIIVASSAAAIHSRLERWQGRG